MLEELNYTSVMKPVFSPDRLATTDLTHTIIGASNLTNSVLASDLCRQALREKRMEIQASPRSVEVKCSDVLRCHSGKVTGSPPSSHSRSPLPRPAPELRALSRRSNNNRGPARHGSAPHTPHTARGRAGPEGKGEAELRDSWSGAAAGTGECEAAARPGPADAPSRLPSDDGGHPAAAVAAVVVLPGQVGGGHEGEALVGAAVLQQHVDALLAAGLPGVGQRRVPMGVARHHVHAVLWGDNGAALG